MVRIFYDTEFLENGSTIELISIGLVADDGSQYYAVSSDMPVDKISRHHWLMDNVVPQLPLTEAGVWNFTGSVERSFTLDTSSSLVKPRWVIANEVRDFLQGFSDLELWAWYGAYDHVALCQLWGAMMMLPKGVPMWTNDLQQLALLTGKEMPEQPGGNHCALEDALFNKVRYEHMIDAETPRLGVLEQCAATVGVPPTTLRKALLRCPEEVYRVFGVHPGE